MEPFSIILGVWGAIMATISAFNDGKKLWKSWREKRRLKKQAATFLYSRACELPQMLLRNPS